MDTVATFEMASALAAQNCFCAVHKHTPLYDWRAFVARSTAAASLSWPSRGASDSDFDKLTDTLALSPNLRMICLDVANGYTELFVSFLKRVRAAFPTHTIMAAMWSLAKCARSSFFLVPTLSKLALDLAA